MRKRIYIIAIALVLSGCQPDEAKTSKSVSIQEVSHIDLYSLPDKPESPAVYDLSPEPEPELGPVDFPDPNPLFNEDEARRKRGQREWLARNKLRQQQKQLPAERESQYRSSDPDYQQWETKFDQTVSTLPVDRSRMITTDMRIGAVLEDNINSQIPGKFIAIVHRDILSANGKKILLPAYSKLVCHYEGAKNYNQTRLSVTCKRILTPEGVSIALQDAQVADQMGRNGVIGDVDFRVGARYGASFVVSGISALAQTSVKSNNEGYRNAANTLSTNLGQVTNEIVRQGLDLKPIITVPAGSRIQMMPDVDIVLRNPVEIEQNEVVYEN